MIKKIPACDVRRSIQSLRQHCFKLKFSASRTTVLQIELKRFCSVFTQKFSDAENAHADATSRLDRMI